MAYLAQNNLMLVSLNVGPYVYSDIPLFYIIVGSMLIGLCLAYFIYVINSIFVAMKLHKRDSKIKESSTEILELTKRVHQLELENEKLKNNSLDKEPSDKNAL